MRIRIEFGLNGSKEEITWWKEIKDFYNLIEYKGEKWEWFSYDEDKTKTVDYIFWFSRVTTYDPNFLATAVDWSTVTMYTYKNNCECGSIYSSFPWDHMRYCPKHKVWEYL